MTSPKLDKIRALLERAAHPATPEEEARTSAVTAARLMREAGVSPEETMPPPPTAKASPRARRAPIQPRLGVPPPVVSHIATVLLSGRCSWCYGAFVPGDKLAWYCGFSLHAPTCIEEFHPGALRRAIGA